jgi:hypothetical protein
MGATHLGLMRNVLKREGTWWVRINVPADLQPVWGKTAEWRSLKTADELDAITRAPPIIREIKERIAELRRRDSPAAPSPPSLHVQLTPTAAKKLIERWHERTIQEALVRAYNGELDDLVSAGEATRAKLLEGLGV